MARFAYSLIVLATLIGSTPAAPPRKAKDDPQAEEKLEAASRRQVENLSADVKKRIETAKKSIGIVRAGNGHGTGFLVAPGVLATNSHVIAGALVKDLTVQFPSPQDPNPKPLPLKLLYEDREADLALLAVETDKPHLTVAGRDRLREGMAVMLIGNPSEFRDEAALNAVSSGNCVELVTNVAPGKKANYFKTSAYAVGGNSGGPALCAATGEVIGVTTRRSSVDEGCVGICLPGHEIAAALRVIGPKETWTKRADTLATCHAAAVAFDALNGGERTQSIRDLAGIAADAWLKQAEKKKNQTVEIVIGDRKYPFDAGMRLLHERMTASVNAAKKALAAARTVQPVPDRLMIGLVELSKQCEEVTDLAGKPLRTKVPLTGVQAYFNRIKVVRADIEKQTTATKKQLDDLNGK